METGTHDFMIKFIIDSSINSVAINEGKHPESINMFI